MDKELGVLVYFERFSFFGFRVVRFYIRLRVRLIFFGFLCFMRLK